MRLRKMAGNHWIATALVVGGAEFARARAALVEAIEAAGGQASGAARRIGYPFPAVYRLIDAFGLLGELDAAKARHRARKQLPPPSASRGGYWITRAIRKGSPAEQRRVEEALRRALRQHEGRIEAAADALGMTRKTLAKVLRQVGLYWYVREARGRAEVARARAERDGGVQEKK